MLNTGLDMFMNVQGKQNIPFRPEDQVLDAANNMAASKSKDSLKVKKKQAIAKAVPKGGPSAPSGMDLAKKNISKGIQKAGQEGMQESNGSTADLAGNALMMSGNPYAMAGGVALKAISGIAERKRKAAQAAQAEADAENKRRVHIQNALSKLGSGVGTMGMA